MAGLVLSMFFPFGSLIQNVCSPYELKITPVVSVYATLENVCVCVS